jgi:hypothetical protein
LIFNNILYRTFTLLSRNIFEYLKEHKKILLDMFPYLLYNIEYWNGNSGIGKADLIFYHQLIGNYGEFMNKLLLAASAAALSTATVAQVDLSGKYEGTLTQAGVYSQTLDLTMVGSTMFGSVTAIVDENKALTDLYTTAKLGSVDLTLGEMTIDDVANTSIIKASTKVGGMTVSVSKPSGGSESLDIAGTFGGIKLSVEDLTRDAREVQAVATVAGVTATVDYQNVTAGTITGLGISTKVAGLTWALDHDKAAAGTTTKEASVSMPVGLLGTAKGGVKIASTDVKTYSLEYTQGILTGKWEKVGDADGVISAIAKISF